MSFFSYKPLLDCNAATVIERVEKFNLIVN